MTRRSACVLGTLAAAGSIAACGGGTTSAYTIVVAAPLTSQPWIGDAVENGARLAVEEIDADGGVGHHRLLLVVRDVASPRDAVLAARDAASRHAAAFVTDGTGAVAASAFTGPAHVPMFVVFDGGASLIDPATRPSVFRIAPSNRVLATRLADYVAGRHPRVAIISDDSSYGHDGLSALRVAFARDRIPVTASKVIPSNAGAVDAQVLAARRSGASLVVVWASAPVVAATVRSARASGWSVPVVTGPTGEDPLVRRQLADHRSWVNGLIFVSFRSTAEIGPKPYETFRAAYEKRFGVTRVGVDDDGTPVVQPPDYAMFPYDAVRLVAAALTTAGATGPPLLAALDNTVIVGANGDERGFVPGVREGVSPDDMYFARFRGFRFYPVTDDVLSDQLPSVAQ